MTDPVTRSRLVVSDAQLARTAFLGTYLARKQRARPQNARLHAALRVIRYWLMNWNTHPVLYQWSHPWHWLTYGQNGTAISALIAFAGLIGLFAYTWYTRNLRDAGNEGLRTAYRPVLIPMKSMSNPEISTYSYDEKTDVPGVEVFIELQNVGNGPALDVHFSYVAGARKDFIEIAYKKPLEGIRFGGSVSPLPKNSSTNLRFVLEQKKVYRVVIDYSDLAENLYQTFFYLDCWKTVFPGKEDIFIQTYSVTVVAASRKEQAKKRAMTARMVSTDDDEIALDR